MERREPTQKALVLAGGGARGSYQVGVWRALMELDWHPQIITGTSVGGLNGAMFVLDLYETARDMWLTIRSKDVMELPEEDADLSALHQFLRSVVKAGGMDVTPLEEIVERVLDEDALRAAPIRFGLVTVEQRGLKPRGADAGRDPGRKGQGLPDGLRCLLPGAACAGDRRGSSSWTAATATTCPPVLPNAWARMNWCASIWRRGHHPPQPHRPAHRDGAQLLGAGRYPAL